MKSTFIKSLGILLFLFAGLSPLLANYSADKLPRYQAIVKAWNDAHNNWHFNDLAGLYADKVLFYGGTLDKKECISSKTNLASPSKIFVQKIISDIKAVDFGKGIIKCEFTKEVIIDDKKAEYPAYLVLKESNDSLQIVCESDEITDASFGFKLSEDLFQPKADTATTAQPITKETVVSEEEEKLPARWPLYTFGSVAVIAVIALSARRRKKKRDELKNGKDA